MRRFASITKLKPGMLEEYKKLHDGIWDEVVSAAHEANQRNFTMFIHEDYIFSYFEYIGNDFEADMEKKKKLAISSEWQKLCGSYKKLIDGQPAIQLTEFWHHDF